MVELYGKTLSRREVAERCGLLSQFAGVRSMTLGDGVERGVRVLEFRNGAGLRFTVLVDRARSRRGGGWNWVGVVSGLPNPNDSGVGALEWRPRRDEG